MGLTLLLDDPFFTGTAGSVEVPGYLPVALAGHPYLADLKQYRRSTIEARRQPVDYFQTPGEQSLNTAALWRRNQADWVLGAGQEFFDERDSDPRRFWKSKGVTPFTRKKLSLLNDTAQARSSSNSNLRALGVGSYLYFVDGQSVLFSTTPAAGPWSTIAGTPAATVNGVTTDGANIYFTMNGNVYRSVLGSTALSGGGWPVAVANASVIRYGNGRLLVAAGAALYEVTATPAATLLYTHPWAGFTWTDIAPAPNGIYACGNNGDRGEIYYIGVTSAGALAVPVIACGLPDGETVNCLAFYGGVLVIGTTVGLRLAQLDSNNRAVFGPAVPVPGGVKAVEPQGQYLWFSWSNYDGVSTGVGRADLGRFTDALVPAYSSDLMVTGQGTVGSIETFSSTRWLCVNGLGLYGETANKVASGDFYSGWMRFGIYEPKVFSSVDFRTEPLKGSVAAELLLDDGTVVSLATSGVAGSLGPTDPFSTPDPQTESMMLHLILTRDTVPTLSPEVRRWTVRALPSPHRTDEILLPIILRSRIESLRGDGEYISYDTLAEFQFLKALEASARVVKFQEGSGSFDVYIDRIEIVPDGWNNDFSFFEGTIMLRLLTIDSAT